MGCLCMINVIIIIIMITKGCNYIKYCGKSVFVTMTIALLVFCSINNQSGSVEAGKSVQRMESVHTAYTHILLCIGMNFGWKVSRNYLEKLQSRTTQHRLRRKRQEFWSGFGCDKNRRLLRLVNNGGRSDSNSPKWLWLLPLIVCPPLSQ